MKWIKDNAGLFGLGILLSSVFLYGLNTQQKIMDVRFAAVEGDLREVKADIRRLEDHIRRLEVQLNQFIISLVGKDKAAVIKKQAEDLFAKTLPVTPPTEKNEKNMAEDVSSKTRPVAPPTKKNEKNMAEDVSTETRPVASENKQVQTK